jgi:cytidine deaminase
MMIPQDTIDELARAARAASKRAYVPYSHYPVGAAALAGSGKVYSGCNIENASFGLTVCAERVAVWSAVAAGEREITAVAVITPNGATPCGACRQVLAEFSAPPDAPERDMIVIMVTKSGNQVLHLSELLPYAFLPRHLSST